MRGAVLALCVIAAGFALPERVLLPVQGAGARDWHPQSFWHEPWGASGVHKGIDIFAPRGRPVLAATHGVRVFQTQLGMGGNVVGILGPKWRVHYYAHLDDQGPEVPLFVARGTRIGAVGNTGNAAGKPPHLHYAVVSVFPLPWRWSDATQGWKKIFFLDPNEILTR